MAQVRLLGGRNTHLNSTTQPRTVESENTTTERGPYEVFKCTLLSRLVSILLNPVEKGLPSFLDLLGCKWHSLFWLPFWSLVLVTVMEQYLWPVAPHLLSTEVESIVASVALLSFP